MYLSSLLRTSKKSAITFFQNEFKSMQQSMRCQGINPFNISLMPCLSFLYDCDCVTCIDSRPLSFFGRSHDGRVCVVRVVCSTIAAPYVWCAGCLHCIRMLAVGDCTLDHDQRHPSACQLTLLHPIRRVRPMHPSDCNRMHHSHDARIAHLRYNAYSSIWLPVGGAHSCQTVDRIGVQRRETAAQIAAWRRRHEGRQMAMVMRQRCRVAGWLAGCTVARGCK